METFAIVFNILLRILIVIVAIIKIIEILKEK